MKSNRIMWILVSIVVFATISVSVTTLRSQEVSCGIQDKSAQEKQTLADFESQFPVADYNAPEETDSQRRTKRKAKNSRYDNSKFVSRDIENEVTEHVIVAEFPPLSAIPVKESDVIVVGEVIQAQAFVSNDKTNVYSEFAVRIEELLKNNTSNALSQGNEIAIDRIGGFVRFPNGNKILHRIQGQLMPRVGKRYVFYLTKTEESPNYRILTGYELNAKGISPLDKRVQYDKYKSIDATSFLKAVRDEIAQLSQSNPKE